MNIFKRFNGFIPLLMLLCSIAVAQPGWASSPTPAMTGGPSLPPDEEPATRANNTFYTIDTECSPTIGGTISVSGFAAAGETVYFTVTPSDGYIVRYVSGRYTRYLGGSYDNSVNIQQDENTGQYYFVMPEGYVRLSATFTTLYNITTECYPPEGGTISECPTSAYGNESITWKVTANPGYHLNFTGPEGHTWYYSSQPNSDGTFYCNMYEEDTKIVAYFGTNTAHNISVATQPDNVGTVSVVSSAMPDEEVTITAAGTEDYGVFPYSNPQYTYEGYYERSVSNQSMNYLNNTCSGKFTMPAADVTVLVDYLPLHTISTVCCPANAGTINLEAYPTYRSFYYGNKFTTEGGIYNGINYSVTPNSGFTIDRIIITYINTDGETVTLERPYYSSTWKDRLYFAELSSSIGGDVTITAVFSPFNITSECVPADGGTIDVPSTASSGQRVDITATPNANYFLTDLTITSDLGDAIPVQFDETSGQPYFIMPAGCGAHIVANFATQHNITCVCDPADAGTMEILPDVVYEGSIAKGQFSVTANDGYILGNVTSDNPNFHFDFCEHNENGDIYTFNLSNEDMVLTAHFVPAGTRHNITVNNETPERGTVDVAETAKPLETVHVTIHGTENFACIDQPLQLYYYDENHEKKSISIKASNIDYDNNIYTVDFVMPNADVVVEPTFEPIYSLNSICIPSEGGWIGTPCNETPFYGNKIPKNSKIHIYCYANVGYDLVSLTISSPDETGQPSAEVVPLDALQQQGYYDLTMPAADVTITATFGRFHSITTTYSPDDGGEVYAPEQYPAGASCGLSIYPNNGYSFDISDISVTYVNQDNETVVVPVITDEYGRTYFIMPDADVTIHADFKPAHNLNLMIDPENGGNVSLIIIDNRTINPNYQYIEWPAALGAGKQMKISFESNEGYYLQGVSLINEETGVETPLTASDGFYTVTMPDADATLKVSYTTTPSLYLLGTANGNSAWNTSGVPFDMINGQYSATVYFKGHSDDENETDGMGYFVLSTANNENNDWDAIADNLLTAPSDKFPALQGEETSSVQQLYNESQLKKFMIPAGIYKITVSPDFTTMTIDKITPTTTINPELYYESLGQVVTFSGTDWMLNIILQINPDEREYAEHVTVTDAAGDWEADHFSNKFVLRSPGLATVTATNSVGYITATSTKQYYVFDYESTPLEFIEASNPIDNPVFSIGSGQPVTVDDELIGVWGAKNILWVKDQGQHSARYLDAPEGTTDFLREKFKIQKREWDQSNWVMLDFGELYPDWETNEETYLAMHKKIASYVDHKIDARTVKGIYWAPGSFLRAANGGGSAYEYTKGMHRILLSEFPVAIEQPVGATLGYPGYVEDPTEEAGKFYEDPSQYMYNHYTPVNFMGYVYKPSYLKDYPGENPFVYSTGIGALDEVADDNSRFFFMQPKDAEVAHVWAVWKGSMTFIDDYTGGISNYYSGDTRRLITRDVFETYQPGVDAQGNHYNSYGIEGAFQVYSWEWNRLPATDADQTPRYGKPEEGFEPNTPYLFHIAILHAYNTHMSPPPIYRIDLSAGNGDDMRDDYDAEFGANLGADSSDIAPVVSGLAPNSRYRVFPLDMTRPSDSTTGVDEAVIDRNDAAYEIVDITYYNVMGMSSKRPFNGINIEVTTYSDGHKTSKKILTRN